MRAIIEIIFLALFIFFFTIKGFWALIALIVILFFIYKYFDNKNSK